MKAKLVRKVLSYMVVATMATAMLTGCNPKEVIEETGVTDVLSGDSNDAEVTSDENTETENDTASDMAEESTDGELSDSVEAKKEVYKDPNGWSVPYDPTYFKVDQQSDKVVFTYTGGKGEPATITFKYHEGKSGKELADEFAKEYGGAQIEDREDFMYVENVKSYFISKEPEDSSKGPFVSAFTRDYKDGGFSMEVYEKFIGDDIEDTNTSDMVTLILGGIQFDK